MIDEINSKQAKINLISEINEGFPHFWIFIIPLDLSYCGKFNDFSEDDSNSQEFNLSNLSDNIGLNSSKDDFISITYNNSLNTLISSDEEIISLKNFTSLEEIPKNKLLKSNNPLNSFIQEKNEKNSLKGISNDSLINNSKSLVKREEEGKERDKIIKISNYIDDNNICKKNSKVKKENDLPLSQIQNYNINIYNPYINCVNICYPPSSCSPFSFTSKKDAEKKVFNKNNLTKDEIMTEKLPLNLSCQNNNNINNLINNFTFNNSNNNINFNMNNSFTNLGENFSVNYAQSDIVNNIMFNNNNNIKEYLNNALNNESENNPKNVVQKIKKKKKKKKKKVDDEYTVEMFGRRGWICEGCNNFNYESRKNCNRCKIPKKPLKKSLILDNKGNKIIGNLINANHKDDWNCYNCGNINYAFRLNCNRCQMKKDDFINDSNEEQK